MKSSCIMWEKLTIQEQLIILNLETTVPEAYEVLEKLIALYEQHLAIADSAVLAAESTAEDLHSTIDEIASLASNY